MAPTHSGTPSHARDARHSCGRSKRIIYYRRSSRKARPRQRLMRARQLGFRLAPRACGRRFRSRLFAPLLVTRSPRQVGLGPHVMDWAVNSRRGRRLGSGDGSGARRLNRAYNGMNQHSAVTFPHSPSSFQPLRPFAFELSLPPLSPTQAAPHSIERWHPLFIPAASRPRES